MDSSGRLMMQNELAQGKTIREYDFIMKQDAEAERRARETGTGARSGRSGRSRRRARRGPRRVSDSSWVAPPRAADLC